MLKSNNCCQHSALILLYTIMKVAIMKVAIMKVSIMKVAQTLGIEETSDKQKIFTSSNLRRKT